jgi:hypothetical protein
MKLFVLLISLFLCLSCQKKYPKGVLESLELAGNNSDELEKVIAHYEKDKKDSLKLKAAIFLIENMKYHSADSILTYADSAFLKAGKITDPKANREKMFEQMLDSLESQRPEDAFLHQPQIDVKNLDADFLINNIELAFKAWHKIPKQNRANFRDFCYYVLPYRNGKEPVFKEDRATLLKKYSWVYDSLSAGVPFNKIAAVITSKFHFGIALKTRDKFPQALSIAQIEQGRVGVCKDGVTYFVHVFRALGVPAADDYVQHWGNHHALGHDWIHLKYGNQNIATDASSYPHDPKDIYPLLKEESIPKVYRTLFAPILSIHKTLKDEDVSPEYVETYSPIIPIIYNPKDTLQAKICVFDHNTGWFPIDEAVLKKGNIQAKNLGINVVYMAGYFENSIFFPLNDPFTFDRNTKTVHFFKPSTTSTNATIERKYPLFSKRYQTKLSYILDMNGRVFQGANDSTFTKNTTLYTIAGVGSPQPQRVKINVKDKFKYVRFYSDTAAGYIAELKFFDKNGNQLNGKVIKSNKTWSNMIADNDPITRFGGKNAYIGLQLNTATAIGAIEFQARNDGNHIYKGDDYELFYWNQDWVSLKKQQAKDTVLNFDKVPQNALLLLKNVTKGGKEEHVFVIDKNKRQRWIGSHVR